MASFLYAYPSPLVFTEEDPKPGFMVYDQEIDGQHIYLSDRELGYENGTLIGAWAADGNVLTDVAGDPIPIDSLFDSLRPFGNLDGLATDSLLYHYFMGHEQRHVQADPVVDTSPLYPADNQPIVLTFSRRWDDTPGFEGWGWEAVIEFADPNRAPDARAIGIYNSAWVYQYTTGAFVYTDTGEVDSEGDPVFKWRTISPPGFATVEKQHINYALLFGANREGDMSLLQVNDEQTNYFWEADQVIPGGEAWVDSGETVTGMAGTVTLVSDVGPFPVGTQVRIEGLEMLVTSIWAGQGLVLDPYRSSTTGAMIEIWQ